MNFASRPASFGPLMDEPLLGYAIPMGSFTRVCEDGEGGGGSGGKGKGGKGGRGSGGVVTTGRGDVVEEGGMLNASSSNSSSHRPWRSHLNETDTLPDFEPIKNLGCPRLCLKSGMHVPERTDVWIAIVQRGECQFVDKVREAQRFGARGVVVGGDDPAVSGNADALVNMYSQGEFLSHTYILCSVWHIICVSQGRDILGQDQR